MSDEVAIALALIENIQREDLNVLEQAAALQRFHTEFGMSHAMIASVVGKARTTVSNLMRLNPPTRSSQAIYDRWWMDMGLTPVPLYHSPKSNVSPLSPKIVDGGMTSARCGKAGQITLRSQS